MKINLNNIDILVLSETLQAIKETLDPHLDNAKEKKRQNKMSAEIKKRDLHAVDKKDETNEAEEEVDDESGVPKSIDKDDTDKPRKDRTGGKGTEDSEKLETPTAKELDKPTIGNVIDKLNALRGGKSLKDPAVKKSFIQYFKNLTVEERTSLLIFITGISQILAGVSTGTEAIHPGDVGIRTKDSEKSSKKTKKSLKDKAAAKEKSSGTEAVPIIVGEGQQKSKIRQIFESYKQTR